MNEFAKSSLVSKKHNIWSVMIDDGRCFEITSAHLLLRKSENTNGGSGLLWTKKGLELESDVRSRAWRIPVEAAFGSKFSLPYDVVYSERPFSNDKRYFKLHDKPISGPLDACLYYNSVVDDFAGGTCASIGAKDVLVWSSQDQPALLEGDDVGFEGLSGAACVTHSSAPALLGLYLRRDDPPVPRWTERSAVSRLDAVTVPRSTVHDSFGLSPQSKALLQAIRTIVEESEVRTAALLKEGFSKTIQKVSGEVNAAHRRVARILSAQQLHALLRGTSISAVPGAADPGV